MMKALFFTLVVFTLGIQSSYAESAKPKYGLGTTRIVQDHDYFVKNKAPDYWAISPYYLPQRDESSCSLASFAMVFNALRSEQALGASDKLITQNGFAEKYKDHPAVKLFFFSHGGAINLEEFGYIARTALAGYGLNQYKVDVIHADSTPEFKKKLHDILVQNEATNRNFVIANFLQSEYTGDPEGAIGHVAPVGAFDAKKDKVLVFDPDREYYEPYWVKFDVFAKGLNTKDGDKTRGILFIHE